MEGRQMNEIRPEVLEDVEDCVRRIQSFQAARGRRVHRLIKRSRKGREELSQLREFDLPIPEDFRALYHNHDGIKPGSLTNWEQEVFFEFRWPQLHMIAATTRIMMLSKRNPMTGRLDAFHSPGGLRMQLDPEAARDGATPLLMTLGTLSRNTYIGFDSTLAMLHSVCAAQDAGILRYRTTREGAKEPNDIEYDPKEVWDVIRPFNPRSDYWAALIEGAVDWDEIDVERTPNTPLNLDPKIGRLIVGDTYEYRKLAEKSIRQTAAPPGRDEEED
jgi:hypothetical protein